MAPLSPPPQFTSLENFIFNYINRSKASISHDTPFADLGLDSIAAGQLADELLGRFKLEVHPDELFGINLHRLSEHLPDLTSTPEPNEDETSLTPTPTIQNHTAEPDLTPNPQQRTTHPPNPFPVRKQSNTYFSATAQKNGFQDYWPTIAPLQNDILQTYITEAFQTLGVDLSEYPHGIEIPPISYLPKYTRLMKRLLDFLESRYIIAQHGDKNKILRGSDPIDTTPSQQLLHSLRTNHPQYSCEANLLELIGPRLASCITGKADPVKIPFGSATSLQIMEDFYANSPMMATLTDQLITFLISYLQAANLSPDHPVRILEVGAGTGATTARLISALEKAGIPVHYTFTDIGPSFISKASTRFRNKYPSMRFETLNIEHPLPPHLLHTYDITLGANVVHATSDRVATCRRLRETLRSSGMLVLAEITRVVEWFDICFGLLDGWWRAEGGRGYPVLEKEGWVKGLKRAMFGGVAVSEGGSEEEGGLGVIVRWEGEGVDEVG